MTHRGPDDSGIRQFEAGSYCLTLAHKRLSIIDLSNQAAQPLNFGSLWISFNGEIYNYQELKAELITHGFQFRTQSDTEVILAAYTFWGPQCLEHFNGMFAIVIWDTHNQTLFVARDRYGIKPLYFWNTTKGLAFASELKQIAHLPYFDKQINTEAAYQYLVYADFSYSADTLWENIYELEPGQSIHIHLPTWSLGQTLHTHNWYTTNYEENVLAENDKQISELLEHHLKEAIRIHLRADVPLGTALSGGLDSSTIAYIVDKQFQSVNAHQTFSATYEENEGDESNYITHMHQVLSCQKHNVHIKADDVIGQLEKATYLHDLPLLGRAILPYYSLCKFIQNKNIKVVLQGQGADEILGGYIEFQRAYLSQLIINKQYQKAICAFNGYRKSQKIGSISNELKRVFYLSRMHTLPKSSQAQMSFLSSDFIDKQTFWEQTNTRLQNTVPNTHKARFTAMRMMLHNVDRASMAYGIEVRLPFLDHRLVEFCLQLPAHFKIRDGVGKYLLRQTMAPYLPPKILNRKIKMGFSSPEATWAKTHLKELYLSSFNSIQNSPIINANKVSLEFRKFLNGSAPFDRIFWRIVAFTSWQKTYGISL